MNLETPLAANTIRHLWYMLKTDEIETEESLKLHLNLNQPPNQLQHQSTVPKSKKRELSRFSKVTSSPDNELEPFWKKRKLSLHFNFSNNEFCPLVSYPTYSNINIFWMIAGNLFSKTQMWAGWNTQRYP